MRLLIGLFLLIVLIYVVVFFKKNNKENFITKDQLRSALQNQSGVDYSTIVNNNCQLSDTLNKSSCEYTCGNKLDSCWKMNRNQCNAADYCEYKPNFGTCESKDCNTLSFNECSSSDYCYTGTERCVNRNQISTCFNQIDETSCNGITNCEWIGEQNGFCNNTKDCYNFNNENNCIDESDGRCQWNNEWKYCQEKNCESVDIDDCMKNDVPGCANVSECLHINSAYIENSDDSSNPYEFNCNNLPENVNCPTNSANVPDVSDCYNLNNNTCNSNSECKTITKNVIAGVYNYYDYNSEQEVQLSSGGNSDDNSSVSTCVPILQANPGSYLKLKNDNTLETKQCPSGTYGENGICIKCGFNEFSSNEGSTSCDTKTVCNNSQFVSNNENYNINNLIPQDMLDNLSIENRNKIISNLNKTYDLKTTTSDRTCAVLNVCSDQPSQYITNLNDNDNGNSLNKIRHQLDLINSKSKKMDNHTTYGMESIDLSRNKNNQNEELNNINLRFSNYNCDNLTSCNNKEYISNFSTQISNMVSINNNDYYTSDRECAEIENCNIGFKDTSDIESSKLDNGMYTENRECAICDTGEYTNTINQPKCLKQPYCGIAKRVNYDLNTLIGSIDVKLFTNSKYNYSYDTNEDIHHFHNMVYQGPITEQSQSSYPNIKIEFDSDNNTEGHMKVFYFDYTVDLPYEESGINMFFNGPEFEHEHERMEEHNYEKYKYKIFNPVDNGDQSLIPIQFKKLNKIYSDSTNFNENYKNNPPQMKIRFEEADENTYLTNSEYQFTLNYNLNTAKITHKTSDGNVIYEIYSESGLPKTEQITCKYCPKYEYQDSSIHREKICKTQPVCNNGEYYGPVVPEKDRTTLKSCSACSEPHTYVDINNHRLESCYTQPVLSMTECAVNYNPTEHTLRLIPTTPTGDEYYTDAQINGHRENCKTQPVCNKGQLISPPNPLQRRTCNDITGRKNCENYFIEYGYMDKTNHREQVAKTNPVCQDGAISCVTNGDCTENKSICKRSADCALTQFSSSN